MLNKSKKIYWIIIGLLLLATSLSFLDRQVLSISILKIKEDLTISDIDYGFINAGFLVSYAIMFTLGGILWIPFLALGIGNVLGGWFSDFVFIRTSNLNLARKIVMGTAATLTVPLVTVGLIHSHVLIIVLMSLAFFAHGLWITNYITSISDVFGKLVTSTVIGLSGSAGAISSLVLNPIIGYVVIH